MRAGESREGQRYFLPKRLGDKIVGIQNGYNYDKSVVLFLLERGEKRVLKIVLPTEEIEEIK